MSDNARRSAVIGMLGVLAIGELTAFHRLAEDAALAPTLTDKAALSQIAVKEFEHFVLLRDHLTSRGVDPEQAMTPFVTAVEEFHRRAMPGDWLEGLVKAYVGDGIAQDFYREVAQFLDGDTRELVHRVLEDSGQAGYVVSRVGEAIQADPSVAGRLALWGRRLLGEAVSQAQSVLAERDILTTLMSADGVAVDAGAVNKMLSRITENHTKRMAALGLAF